MNKTKINFKCVNTIKEKLGNVYALLLLNDNRIATALTLSLTGIKFNFNSISTMIYIT